MIPSTRTPWTPAERRMVRTLRLDGVSQKDIAAVLPGRSVGSINFLCHAHGYGRAATNATLRGEEAHERKRLVRQSPAAAARAFDAKVSRQCLSCGKAFVAPTRFLRLCVLCREHS